MKYKTIKWSIVSSPDCPDDNAIGIVTLNRPEHSNALGPRMGMELDQVMDEIKHSSVRVVIITGKGKNFSLPFLASRRRLVMVSRMEAKSFGLLSSRLILNLRYSFLSINPRTQTTIEATWFSP